MGSLALAACGAVEPSVAERRGNFTLEQARAFDDFPLYFAGERVADLPLVALLRRNDTANYVSFVYGDCLPTASDQGCAPPAEIQVWPACQRHLGHYGDASARGSPAPEVTTIRDVPAAFFDGGTRLEVYTRGATVVAFAESRDRVLLLAQALRLVKASGPRGDLQPPVRGAVEGAPGC